MTTFAWREGEDRQGRLEARMSGGGSEPLTMDGRCFMDQGEWFFRIQMVDGGVWALWVGSSMDEVGTLSGTVGTKFESLGDAIEYLLIEGVESKELRGEEGR